MKHDLTWNDLTPEEQKILTCYRNDPRFRDIMKVWVKDPEAGRSLMEDYIKELEGREVTA